MNDTDTIARSFSDNYRTTVLSEVTAQNKLHDIQLASDRYQVYRADQINTVKRAICWQGNSGAYLEQVCCRLQLEVR